jgi:hypothetical protein
MKRLNCSRDVYVKWAGSRETISTPVEARVFFLTSHFIELIDPDCGEQRAQACAKAWFRQPSHKKADSGATRRGAVSN